jgi:hypothetical protein
MGAGGAGMGVGNLGGGMAGMGMGNMGGGMAGMGMGGMGMGGPGGMAGMSMGGMGGGTARTNMLAQREFQHRIEINVLAAALAEAEKDEAGPAKKGSVREILERPLTLAFANETPLRDVLQYIKVATAKSGGKPLSIYVDPRGLAQADASLDSKVTIDLDGIPLRMALRLLLKQLNLAYCVRDGVLIISSVEGVREELAEAASETFGNDPDKLESVLQSMGIPTHRGGIQ